ncbi:MAG: hypothetical protein LH603_09175, partial [Pseudonocardia sp.]|nr:hypothetical protein [Pseudonocardia sp.]
MRRGTLELMRRDRPALVLVVVLTCATAVASLAGPWLLGLIVTRVQNGTADVGTVNLLAVGVLVCGVARLLLTRYTQLTTHRFGERALAGLREEVVDRALALPARIVKRMNTGDLLTRSSLDVGNVAPPPPARGGGRVKGGGRAG